MALVWSCLCADGLVWHVWSTEVCANCGAKRDDMVRTERDRLIETTLSAHERRRLQRLYEKWLRGECD